MGLTLYLLPLIAVHFLGQAYSSYVVLAPNKFRPNWGYDIVVIVNEKTAADVNINGKILNTDEVEVATASATITQKDTPQKLTFQIPEVVEDSQFTLQVTGTGGLSFTNSTKVDLGRKVFLTFIQTDKSIYKANQNVLFRVMTVNKDLEPQKKPATLVIKNPKGAALSKFEIDGTKEVFSDSYQLTEFPEKGDWTIKVASEDGTILEERSFKVDEYVPQSFEVNMKTDPGSVVLDGSTTTVMVTFSAKYTYGLDVIGDYKVIVQINGDVSSTPEVKPKDDVFLIPGRRPPKDNRPPPLVIPGKMTEARNGTVSVEVDLPKDESVYIRHYTIKVAVTDKTEQMYDAMAVVKVVRDRVKLEFDEAQMEKVFRTGMPIQAVVKITDHNGKPLDIANPQTLKLTTEWWSSDGRKEIVKEEALTPGQFAVKITAIDSARAIDSYTLVASIVISNKEYSTSKTISRYQTNGNATLTLTWPTDSSAMLKLGSVMSYKVDLSDKSHFTSLAYLIVSRGNIQAAGKIDVNTLTPSPIRVTTNMCPNGKLIVYGVTSISSVSTEPEIIADSLDLKLEHCQNKKVTTSIESPKQKTGTEVAVNFKVAWTDPSKSDTAVGVHYVHMLGVDKSIILLEGTNDITSQEVDERLEEFSLAKPEPSGVDPHVMFKRSIWPRPQSPEVPTSTGELLKSLGLASMTDAVMKSSPNRYDGPVIMEMMPMGGGANDMEGAVMKKGDANADAAAGGAAVAPEPVVTVRKNFPDTWLWETVPTDPSGHAVFQTKTPDTITGWSISAFAVKKDAETAFTFTPFELDVYNDFFLVMNLPYSIRRTEIFVLIISIFNYSPDVQKVTVMLAEGAGFAIIGEKSKGITVVPNRATSIDFLIRADKIGSITLNATAQSMAFKDTVIKPLIVKPEGIERERVETFTFFVKGSGEPTIDQNFTLEFPPVPIVEDSKRVEVKITGDLMGNAMSDLDALLKVPFGCGEQNMIITGPNVFAVDYLDSIGELDEDFRNRAAANVKKGYLKETQQYRFADGGYSAFGERDGNASTWLTGFVLKTFAYAGKYFKPPVDFELLGEDAEILLDRYKDGVFEEHGRVIHREMVGGTSAKGPTLTTYVTTGLLEAVKYGIKLSPENEQKLNAAKRKLAEVKHGGDRFLAAILAYALSLLDQPDQTKIENLIKFAKSKPAPTEKKEEDVPGVEIQRHYVHKSGPSEVEIIGYCLLAYCQLKKLPEGRELVLWLQKQQNGNGGFSSTQDTVVALQAIASYATLSNEGGGSSTTKVEVTPLEPQGPTQTVAISPANRILLQSVKLNEDTTKVNLKVTGAENALAVVKVVWHYYTMPGDEDIEESKKDAKKPKLDTSAKAVAPKTLEVQVCTPESARNMLDGKMSIQVLDLPSGRELVPGEMQKLVENYASLARAEMDKHGLVTCYFNEPPPECMHFNMQEVQTVENVKEGTVRLQAYYEPEVNFEAPIPVVACTGAQCTPPKTTPPTSRSSNLSSSAMSGLLIAASICLLSILLAM